MLQALRGWWEKGRKYPSDGWLDTARKEASFTPDVFNLEASPMQLLFLPCELQDKHIRGELTSRGGAVLFKGFTVNTFSLVRDREDNSALFLDDPSHQVKGEVWAILSNFISELDKYKDNGVLSDRRRIDVQIPYTRFIERPKGNPKGQSETVDIPVWAYVNPIGHWEDKLDGGFRYPSIRLFKPNNPLKQPFYYYRPDEIKR